MKILPVANNPVQNQNRKSNPNFGAFIKVTNMDGFHHSQVASGIIEKRGVPFMLFRSLVGGAIDKIAMFYPDKAWEVMALMPGIKEEGRLIDLSSYVKRLTEISQEDLRTYHAAW